MRLPATSAPAQPHEDRHDEAGRVIVRVGVNSQGQGHETTIAQICAEHLGARYEDVLVFGGDTSRFAIGYGTAASRVLVNAGNATMRAAVAARRKILAFAGALMECDQGDLVVKDGVVSVVGVPQLSLSFGELASRARCHAAMAELGGPPLGATEFFYPRTVTWSSGVHAAVIELDQETGEIAFLAYAVVHDCGVPVNPMIVEGQIRGGFAQGVGAAILEQLVYDANGQVLSGSLMDYAVPRATDVPTIDLSHFLSPTLENPLGPRGVGESGPISAPAALAAAVEDALEGRVRVARVPLTPRYVFELIREGAQHAPATSLQQPRDEHG
jgi:aerobic carbon-monoxide dehydrogenase large subunit